jgi:anaerobic magnesium-protoporphyrin IX monomethyl ester cyclase
MKRVLLINTNTETKPYPVPPLGLCLIAKSISDKYSVRIYDGTFQKNTGLTSCIEDFEPEYIGFSMRNIDDMTFDNLSYYVDAVNKDFIEPVRKITSVPMIIGGSGFSIFPRQLMKLYDLDYGIVGAGEQIFPQLLSLLDRGITDIKIPGVITSSYNGTALNTLSHAGNRYQQLPSNIDQWVDYGPYRLRGAYNIQTKRGCGFHCIYCTYPQIEGCGYRLREPAYIVDEIEQVHQRLGDITFEFVDSVFNDPPGHAEAICTEISGRGLKLRLRTMGINPVNCSRELMRKMLNAGFSQIDVTPDTASPSMLVNLHKNFLLAQLAQTAELIKEMNIPTMWFFVFGGPGETRGTIDETFDFIDRYIHPEDMVHVTSGLRIYPATALAEKALREKVITPEDDLLIPRFYFPADLPHAVLSEILTMKCSTRPNCLLSSESTPPPAMMAEAIEIRKQQNLTEPMFRTLLRIRNRDYHNKA